MAHFVIDFDKQFSRYMAQWLKAHRSEYANAEAIEAAMPDVYADWLERPAKWLDGVAPNHYFEQFTDPQELFTYMQRYMVANVGVPDPMMDQLTSFGEALHPMLLSVLQGDMSGVPNGVDHEELKLVSLSLLQETSTGDLSEAVLALMAVEDQPEALLDAASEVLKTCGEAAVEGAVALLPKVSAAAQTCLLDFLCEHPGHPEVLEALTARFVCSDDEKALFASYLAKYGDPAALKVLEPALQAMEITYLDYLEIRNAVEVLGGQVAVERDFSGDRFYESLKLVEG